MKTEELFVVFKPTFESEKTDVFSGQPTTLQSLYNQFLGGLKPEMIHGVYTKKEEAEKEWSHLYLTMMYKRNENDPFSFPKKERFKKFIRAFEELSTKYGVIITSTGGVTILPGKKKTIYQGAAQKGSLFILAFIIV